MISLHYTTLYTHILLPPGRRPGVPPEGLCVFIGCTCIYTCNGEDQQGY